MKDIFNNPKPIQIEDGEWWFNGNIIQKQHHPRLLPYAVFADKENDSYTHVFISLKLAVEYALANPCMDPSHFPKDYIGGYKITKSK